MNPVFIDAAQSYTIVLRLVIAVIVGGIVGWNRQAAGKPAGLRTHMLVSLGAATIILIPLQTDNFSADAVSRSIQGISTGVGFLGAGVIFHASVESRNRPRIKGLTSAAAIWMTAALGMVTGCGLWLTALTSTFLVFLILTVVKKLERLGVVRQENDNSHE